MLDNNFITNSVMFNQQQIDYLSSLHFINQIDASLKAVSSIDINSIADNVPPRVLLALEIYFYDRKVDILRFDLHNYEYDEIVHIARNVRDNEFLLQEIDNFLAGDIVE
jgi:hypothetical protein